MRAGEEVSEKLSAVEVADDEIERGECIGVESVFRIDGEERGGAGFCGDGDLSCFAAEAEEGEGLTARFPLLDCCGLGEDRDLPSSCSKRVMSSSSLDEGGGRSIRTG